MVDRGKASARQNDHLYEVPFVASVREDDGNLCSLRPSGEAECFRRENSGSLGHGCEDDHCQLSTGTTNDASDTMWIVHFYLLQQPCEWGSPPQYPPPTLILPTWRDGVACLVHRDAGWEAELEPSSTLRLTEGDNCAGPALVCRARSRSIDASNRGLNSSWRARRLLSCQTWRLQISTVTTICEVYESRAGPHVVGTDWEYHIFTLYAHS